MLLNWCDPNAEYTDVERLIGVLFDSSVIKRSDLMYLLNWKRSKFDHQLLQLRQRGLVVTSRDYRMEAVYLLTEAGIKFAHQLCHVEGKIITFEAQFSHQLGLNNILLRFLRQHGRESVKWYSTREASDELFNFRKIAGQSDKDIRTNFIRPDALLRSKINGIFWVEYDNATESSRQIRKKYMLYIQNLSTIDEVTKGQMRRVVWVAPTADRTRWLEARWKEVKDRRQATNVEMLFFTAGEETSFLAGQGIKDQQTV